MQYSQALKQLRKPLVTWRTSAANTEGGISRHFRCSYLKANKVSKSEGTSQVEYVCHI